MFAEVQRRSTPIIISGSDAVIQSETGSGKTAAFLVPALSRLAYPPQCEWGQGSVDGACLGLLIILVGWFFGCFVPQADC